MRIEIYQIIINALLWGHEWSNVAGDKIINKVQSNSVGHTLPRLTHQFIPWADYCISITETLSSLFRHSAHLAEVAPTPVPPFSATIFCI